MFYYFLAQRHLLRGSCEDEKVYLAVFLSFVEKQLIIVFEPLFSAGQLVMNLMKTLYPPQVSSFNFLTFFLLLGYY